MAAERYTVRTGIYRRTGLRASGKDGAGGREVVQALTESLTAYQQSLKNLRANLNEYDRQAIAIEWDTADMEKMWAELARRYPNSEMEPPPRFDEARKIKGHYLDPNATADQKRDTADTARMVQLRVQEIRSFLESHASRPLSEEELDRVIILAIDLGRRIEELQIRPLEPVVAVGRASTEGAKAGGRKRAIPADEKERRKNEYLATLQAVEKKHPNQTRKAAIKRVAKIYGVSSRTIERYLR